MSNSFIKKLNSIDRNLPLIKNQINLIKKNPRLENNDCIESLVSTLEFIPKVLDELLDAEDISL